MPMAEHVGQEPFRTSYSLVSSPHTLLDCYPSRDTNSLRCRTHFLCLLAVYEVAADPSYDCQRRVIIRICAP